MATLPCTIVSLIYQILYLHVIWHNYRDAWNVISGNWHLSVALQPLRWFTAFILMGVYIIALLCLNCIFKYIEQQYKCGKMMTTEKGNVRKDLSLIKLIYTFMQLYCMRSTRKMQVWPNTEQYKVCVDRRIMITIKIHSNTLRRLCCNCFKATFNTTIMIYLHLGIGKSWNEDKTLILLHCGQV